VGEGLIRGHHKLRHRRNGGFCWVDMHIQVDPAMTVAESHALASRIEYDIECALGAANATAHVEPDEPRATSAPASP
jgi:divalent metal cation (Fe/Co/Zn/Cd) transporter